MSRALADRLEALVFDRRNAVVAIFALASAILAVTALQLRADAGFDKHLPMQHPYLRTFLEHQGTFGGANRVLVALRARDGDLFDARSLETLRQLTAAMASLRGVDRSSVRSIFTPDVRFVEVVEGGFAGGNVVPSSFRPTPEHVRAVRENVLKAGLVGSLIANDFSAAMVSADLVAPELDALDAARELEEQIRARFADRDFDIHIMGFAKAVGDIAAGARAVIGFFAFAVAVIACLVYGFVGSLRLSAMPLVCALAAVVWTLGLLPVPGFGLDPMSVLLPFLVFGIGASHGIQMVLAAAAEIATGADGEEAARRAFRRLLAPCATALISDALGFITILLIDIRIIRELAITASLGIAAITLINLVLLPALLSYLGFEERQRQRLRRSAARTAWLWRRTAGLARPGPAAVALVAALALLALALPAARDIRIGDLHAGMPELRPDARYNRDADFITRHFAIAADMLQVMVETVPDGCVRHDVMAEIDRFQWHMANVPGVLSTLSLPQVAKVINAGWNEGSLKWRVLPRDPASLAQAVAPIEISTRLLNGDCSVMPVMIFTADHRAETIDRLIAAAQRYVPTGDLPLEFRLAMGNLGLMAATNDVVRAAQVPILLWVYAAIVALCLLTFRSLAAVLCIILPLGLVSVLVYALMSVLGIGLKVATLPVAALGVGIGVDYGIYIFARLQEQQSAGLPFPEACRRTLEQAGNAVLATGLTLAAGVGTWLLSPLQFQADMGLLLGFMLLANMAGALLLLPALAASMRALPRWPRR